MSEHLFPSKEEEDNVAVAPNSTNLGAGMGMLLWKSPLCSDTNIRFSPHRVCTALLVDYAVVHAVHSVIIQALHKSRFKGVVLPVSVMLPELVSTVSVLIHSRTSLRELNRGSLEQVVPAIVKKLIAFGELSAKEGLLAGGSSVEWNAQIVGKRKKELVIGRGSFDPTCDVFCEVCVRVKCFMDESSPLPGNMKWAARKQRVRRVGGDPRRVPLEHIDS